MISTCDCPLFLNDKGEKVLSDMLKYLLITGSQIPRCYQRRRQIEHGFRDTKTGVGFRHLVLKKQMPHRVNLLWLLAGLTYGLLFIRYEQSADRWAKAFTTQTKGDSLFMFHTSCLHHYNNVKK